MAKNNEKKEHDQNSIYSNDIMSDVISSVSSEIKTNNLKDFKKYLENNNEINEYTNDIKYTYNLNLQIYNKDTSEGIIRLNPSNIMNIMGMNTDNSYTNTNMMSSDVFTELTNNERLLKSQYDMVSGRLPKKYNEVILIVDKNNEISDYTLYSLGIKRQKELTEMMKTIYSGKEVEKHVQTKYDYDELINKEFKVVLNSDIYKKENGIWVNK